MELLLLGPAHLHQCADLDGSLANRYFTAQKRRFLKSTRSNDAKAALAHIVDAPRNRAAFGLLGADIWKGGNGHSKVLGEPCLPATIAFGCCPHAKLSLREQGRKYILQMA